MKSEFHCGQSGEDSLAVVGSQILAVSSCGDEGGLLSLLLNGTNPIHGAELMCSARIGFDSGFTIWWQCSWVSDCPFDWVIMGEM